MLQRLVAVAVVLSFSLASPAASQEGSDRATEASVETLNDAVELTGEASGSSPGSDTSPDTAGGSGGNEEPGFEQAIWLFRVGGQECWRTVSVAVGTTPVDIPAGTPPCDPAVAADPITPAEWVVIYVETTAPARPIPGFVPPYGITGEPMYLVTEAPITWVHETADTPFGPLTIVGEATVVVDWGTGEEPLRYAAAGEAWPDGELVHTWTEVGDYDITVTYEWTLDWSFASDSGQLPLPHTETISAYPVTELQPVIRRP